MHIAAINPSVTKPEDLEPSIVKEERDRLIAEARASKKPENIIDKMVDGRMKVFYAEQGVLQMQPFAKDDSKTVSPGTFRSWCRSRQVLPLEGRRSSNLF